MSTCAWLVIRPGQTIIGTCGKPAVAVIGKLEVCAEHKALRERKPQVVRQGGRRITKLGDLVMDAMGINAKKPEPIDPMVQLQAALAIIPELDAAMRRLALDNGELRLRLVDKQKEITGLLEENERTTAVLREVGAQRDAALDRNVTLSAELTTALASLETLKESLPFAHDSAYHAGQVASVLGEGALANYRKHVVALNDCITEAQEKLRIARAELAGLKAARPPLSKMNGQHYVDIKECIAYATRFEADYKRELAMHLEDVVIHYGALTAGTAPADQVDNGPAVNGEATGPAASRSERSDLAAGPASKPPLVVGQTYACSELPVGAVYRNQAGVEINVTEEDRKHRWGAIVTLVSLPPAADSKPTPPDSALTDAQRREVDSRVTGRLRWLVLTLNDGRLTLVDSQTDENLTAQDCADILRAALADKPSETTKVSETERVIDARIEKFLVDRLELVVFNGLVGLFIQGAKGGDPEGFLSGVGCADIIREGQR